jgi:phosphomannomutase/phosphoglucomutase
MAPHCGDAVKYEVVARTTRAYEEAKSKGATIAGRRIRELVTVNGVRVVLEDGTWGLVRASSNKPSLVIVVESPTSEAMMKSMFQDIDNRLSTYSEVGEYDQKLAV